MTINDIINGPEGAQNSSNKHNDSIEMPDNGSYEKSLYIAAIQETYGFVGLASPITILRDGISYTFHFYHPDEQVLVKVFKHDDLSEFEMYAQYPGEKIIIVDAEGCDLRLLELQCDDEPRLCISEKIGRPVANVEHGCIYFDQCLWEPDGAFTRGVNFNQDLFRVERTAGSGTWSVWRPLTIFEHQEGGAV